MQDLCDGREVLRSRDAGILSIDEFDAMPALPARDRDSVSGVILVGGRSRRFGADKATFSVGRRTLLEATALRLSSVVSEIVVVGLPNQDLSLPGDARFVPDTLPGEGPLTALLTGLKACTFPRTVAVSCNLPFLNPDVLQLLLKLSARAHCDACVPVAEGKPQVLHAVYARSIIPVLQSLVEEGECRLSRLLERVKTHYVDEESLGVSEASLLTFFNLNTPADYLKAWMLRRMVSALFVTRALGNPWLSSAQKSPMLVDALLVPSLTWSRQLPARALPLARRLFLTSSPAFVEAERRADAQ